MRILIYTHNTMGLGHTVRACSLAHALDARFNEAAILLVGGANIGRYDWLPERVDHVKLPSYERTIQDKQFTTRPRIKGLRKRDLHLIRQAILAELLSTYSPDVCIVDFFPCGKMQELMPALLQWKQTHPRSLLCYGLRGIIDSPERAFTEALALSDLDALHLYDVIWAYCDPRVVDVLVLHPEFRAFEGKLVYTGYISRPRNDTTEFKNIRQTLGVHDNERLIVASLGSGWMTEKMLSLIAGAVRQLATIIAVRCVVLYGTYLDLNTRELIAELEKEYRLFLPTPLVPDPAPYLMAASLFIGRGGYNTLTDVIRYGPPTIIIPATDHGAEQVLHARRLSEEGYCYVRDEETLTEESLVREILALWERPLGLKSDISLDGATYAAEWLAHALTSVEPSKL